MCDMINLTNNICKEEDYDSAPSLGIRGGKRSHCGRHKKLHMVNLKNKLYEYEECGAIPVFDIEGGKPTHCGRHRTDDMINVLQPTCRSEWCTYQVRGTK